LQEHGVSRGQRGTSTAATIVNCVKPNVIILPLNSPLTHMVNQESDIVIQVLVMTDEFTTLQTFAMSNNDLMKDL
jgi:hypothetical protein